MRLAARVAHTCDVDGLWDWLGREKLDEWIAYYQIETDPLDRIATILTLGFSGVCAGLGMTGVEPKNFDPPAPLAGETIAEAELTPTQQVLTLVGVPGMVPDW